MWNFETPKGLENWKVWSRSAKDALFTMSILDVLTDDSPEKPTVITKVVDKQGDETMVPMNKAEKDT